MDDILGVSVNDPYVTEAWSHDQEADKVPLAADGNGGLEESIGMLVDKRDLGYGPRS